MILKPLHLEPGVPESPLRVIIYPPPHQTRPPILNTVETNTTALDIAIKAAILFCMSPTCVDAHYLYFGTRNKHTPASTPGDRSAILWGDTTLEALAWGGSDYPRAHTHCLSVLRVNRDKHICFCAQRTAVVKIHCRASLKNPGLSRTMDSEMEMLSSSRTRASPKVKSSQSSERRQQYGLKTKSTSSNVLR